MKLSRLITDFGYHPDFVANDESGFDVLNEICIGRMIEMGFRNPIIDVLIEGRKMLSGGNRSDVK